MNVKLKSYVTILCSLHININNKNIAIYLYNVEYQFVFEQYYNVSLNISNPKICISK